MACICYISRERVDTLFEQAFDGVVEEEVRETSEDRVASWEPTTPNVNLVGTIGPYRDAFDKAVKRSHSH